MTFGEFAQRQKVDGMISFLKENTIFLSFRSCVKPSLMFVNASEDLEINRE